MVVIRLTQNTFVKFMKQVFTNVKKQIDCIIAVFSWIQYDKHKIS